MDQMDGLMVNSIMVYYGGSVFKIAFATDRHTKRYICRISLEIRTPANALKDYGYF